VAESGGAVMSKHTPADTLRLYSDSLICCDQDGVSDHFCQVSHRVRPGEQAANARFIFHACKSFEENQALIADQAGEIERLRSALEPFGKFADAFDRMPLRQISDRLYNIHSGTEYECHLSLSDCRKAREVLQDREAENA
jgi:hypothetical protein